MGGEGDPCTVVVGYLELYRELDSPKRPNDDGEDKGKNGHRAHQRQGTGGEDSIRLGQEQRDSTLGLDTIRGLSWKTRRGRIVGNKNFPPGPDRGIPKEGKGEGGTIWAARLKNISL